jgi:hypothetical protein
MGAQMNLFDPATEAMYSSSPIHLLVYRVVRPLAGRPVGLAQPLELFVFATKAPRDHSRSVLRSGQPFSSYWSSESFPSLVQRSKHSAIQNRKEMEGQEEIVVRVSRVPGLSGASGLFRVSGSIHPWQSVEASRAHSATFARFCWNRVYGCEFGLPVRVVTSVQAGHLRDLKTIDLRVQLRVWQCRQGRSRS